MKTKIISIANQKGGVGKTTTSITFSKCLNDLGFKTLLIDCDGQCNSTDTYQAIIEGQTTLYDVILEVKQNKASMKEAIQHTNLGDIVASDPLIKMADATLSGRPDGTFMLKESLESLKESEEYDYIILDCPPSLGQMLVNALVASDYTIIVIEADRYSVQGVDQLMSTIKSVQKYQNRDLQVKGFLMNMWDARTNLSKSVEQAIESIAAKVDTIVFKTKIRNTIKTREAQVKKMSIIEYDSNATSAIDFKNFTLEFLESDK